MGRQQVGLAQPLAMIGHPNFAHYMWNELPALNAALRDRPVETRSLFAPLGPLEGLPRPAAFKPLAFGVEASSGAASRRRRA